MDDLGSAATDRGFIVKRLALAVLILVGCASSVKALESPAASPAPITPPATVSSILGDSGAPKTTTTAPKPIPGDAYCPEWWPLAREVGWPEDALEMLDFVIWRESRCLPNAWNGADAGLLQINQIHKEFVAVMGFTWPEGMFDPRSVLTFGLKLWTGKDWEPWGF